MHLLSTLMIGAHAVLDIIFPPRDSQVAVRNATHNDLVALLYIQTTPEWTALLSYSDTLVRSAVVEAKFHGSQKAARMLGMVLHKWLQDFHQRKEIVIIPIPLSRARHSERGYNQVERICAYAELSPPCALLHRTRDTSPQTTLGASERRDNVQDAFMCASTVDSSKHYIVIDDVVTTGGTLGAAVAALKSAGATHVHAVALAHQPRNGTV